MAGAFSAESAFGNVEKSRQRRSRQFAVLTYCEYAPRVKLSVALLDGPTAFARACFFDHSHRLLVSISSRAFMGHVRETFNRELLP